MNPKRFIRDLIKTHLRRRGLRIAVIESREERNQRDEARALAIVTRIAAEFGDDRAQLLLEMSNAMTAQLGQDCFALWASGMKRGGFFVEFGAYDGVQLSNTIILEKQFGWTGILAEPLPEFAAALRANRSAAVETACVWRSSGERLEFVRSGMLSTIESHRSSDFHASARSAGETFSVMSISLIDLLRRHNAPSIIDFLSIDTEGSEYEILSAFPFNSGYRILAIACEHNHTSNRDLVADLLQKNGYRRILTDVSAHDDWFILESDEGP